jgi:hypothetical protein
MIAAIVARPDQAPSSEIQDFSGGVFSQSNARNAFDCWRGNTRWSWSQPVYADITNPLPRDKPIADMFSDPLL